MSEFTDGETFLKLIADRLRENGVEITDEGDEGDEVNGSLETIVFAVLDVHSECGPVLFGD